MNLELRRRLLAEFVGTAFLLAGIVGSGIMAERLSEDVGVQLLANALATGGVLVALILALGSVSGAHFNPVVTAAARAEREIDTRTAIGHVVMQFAGAIVGVIVANLMFDLPGIEWSDKERSGGHLLLAEVVATLGLVLVIFAVVRSGRTNVVAFAVAGYISGAYFFTSSTSFANPAVTVARSMSDTFAGIDPSSVPAFVIAQVIGAVLALVLARAMFDDSRSRSVPDLTQNATETR